MARGIDTTQAREYILEDDRSLPKEEQTVFWIKPKDGAAANRTTARYLKTIEETRGRRELNVSASNAADIEEFCDVVEKVENFAFSDAYYDRNTKMKEKAEDVKLSDGSTVPYVPVLSERWEKAEVAKNLPNKWLREVLDKADDISSLGETEKNG